MFPVSVATNFGISIISTVVKYDAHLTKSREFLSLDKDKNNNNCRHIAITIKWSQTGSTQTCEPSV